MNAVNVADHLERFAGSDPHRVAVIDPARASLTFAQLQAESDALAKGLLSILPVGSRVAVMVPPSLEFFKLAFALFKAALVPVMIDPGMGMANVGTCLAEAEPAAFIGILKAQAARSFLAWCPRAIGITAGRRRWWCRHSTQTLSHSGPFTPPPVSVNDIAAILFTSGSTGLAKGAVYTHGIFAAQVEMLKSIYGIEPGEIDLCTFPLFALFGPALGMTCVIPRMNASRPATINPATTIAAIQKHAITNLFGSPAVIRRLGEHGAGHRIQLHGLRRVISAGAPARLDEIERFQALLKNDAEVFTPYGATEALPVANINSRELLTTRPLTESGHGICIGRPVPGVTVHIIPIDDGTVPVFDANSCLKPGEIGELAVRGPTVTKCYFRRDEATTLAKMTDPATGETLHRMGDVGYFDGEGRLWFCGRKSQRVVLASSTLFTDQVEPVFNALANIHRTALVRVDDEPVVCVELISTENQYETSPFDENNPPIPHGPVLWRHVLPNLQHRASLFAHTRCITTFLRYPMSFPVDPRHNSKINREKLAAWATKQLAKSKLKP